MNREAMRYGLIGLLLGVVLTVGVVGFRYNYQMAGGMMDKKEMNTDKRVVSPGMTMAGMNEALKNKSGDEFDEAFTQMMIEHHQGAIDMANLIPNRAKHDEIKKLGEAIIAAQTKEINEMREWAQRWGYSLVDESPTPMMRMNH